MPIQQRQALFEIPQATSTTDSGRSGVAVGYITPAVTFTNSTASSASGGTKTTLTSIGAHGLTSAVAVGKHLYISTGTNWTAGFYNISSIDLDTTGVVITIDVAFNAGFGSPTIALAGTEVTLRTIQIPPLGPNSYIEIDATWTHPNNANPKTPRVHLGGLSPGNRIYTPGVTTSMATRPSSIILQNRGSTNSQINSFSASSASGNGTIVPLPNTFNIDTSIATILYLSGLSSSANDYIYLEEYRVYVYK